MSDLLYALKKCRALIGFTLINFICMVLLLITKEPMFFIPQIVAFYYGFTTKVVK